jgi:alginate O-acetyltransferase complex protein AlgI
MLNFDHPYHATGLGDFWSRWHISLSSWFRDYLYIPLGGSRGGPWATARNLFLTMLISGLWHGASWTFITWGALHGLAYAGTRRMERSEWYQRRIPTAVKQLAIFAFVCFTWIFFRAANMSDAWLIIHRIGGSAGGDPRFPLLALALIVCLWCYESFCESAATRRLLDRPAFRVGAVVGMILYLCLAPGSADVPFVYFQF